MAWENNSPLLEGFAFFVYLILILITRAGDFRQSMQNYVSEVNDWLLLLLLLLLLEKGGLET